MPLDCVERWTVERLLSEVVDTTVVDRLETPTFLEPADLLIAAKASQTLAVRLTDTGLVVRAALDEAEYETGIKVSDDQLAPSPDLAFPESAAISQKLRHLRSRLCG